MSDGDCSDPTAYCLNNDCVECREHDHCAGGYACTDNECVQQGM